MKNARVARRYAMALMSAAEEHKAVEEVAQDLAVLGDIFRVSRELRMLVASPVVPVERKLAVFQELFGRRVSKQTLMFIKLMTSKHREDLLPELVEQFNALRDEKLGIVNVDVKSAVDVSPSQRKDLETRLEKHTRKKVRLRFSVDKDIKGGLVLRIGDTVLDASVRRQLELLRARFVYGPGLSNE
jgi:F-type H+-transporting ATPase subunit delta